MAGEVRRATAAGRGEIVLVEDIVSLRKGGFFRQETRDVAVTDIQDIEIKTGFLGGGHLTLKLGGHGAAAEDWKIQFGPQEA
jgi:hypothetical protein